MAHVLGAVSSIYPRFELGNASISIIQIADGNPRLISLNDTSHLEVAKIIAKDDGDG